MTTKEISYEKWNERIRQLAQAMVGTISPNFRMITIEHDGKEWELKFYLETETNDDLEEVEEIIFLYEALHRDKCRYKTVITNVSLSVPASPVVTVFKRREQS